MKRDSNHHESDETGTAFGKIITIASTTINIKLIMAKRVKHTDVLKQERRLHSRS